MIVLALGARFDYASNLAQAPIIEFVLIQFCAGIVFLALLAIIPRVDCTRGHIVFLIAIGLLMRAILLPSEPILEIDFYRYLWDGGVLANAFNPYSMAPADALNSGDTDIRDLAASASLVHQRINYADLRTIYPPVAQAGFMLAHLIDSWSLFAWRVVILICECISLALIFLLLKHSAQSPLWSTLYWWNPLVVKELINSAHSDALLVPLLLASVYFLMRHQSLRAGIMIVMAAGVKLWPLLLMAFALRPNLANPRRLLFFLAVCAGVATFAVAPIFIWGLGDNSGLTGYSTEWIRNASAFVLLEKGLETLGVDSSASAARLLVAFVVVGITIALSARLQNNHDSIVTAAIIVASSLFLLSPTQYPWYFVWFAPLLAVIRIRALLLLTSLLSIYYLRFYFEVNGNIEIFNKLLVWIQFVPVWCLLLFDHLKKRNA